MFKRLSMTGHQNVLATGVIEPEGMIELDMTLNSPQTIQDLRTLLQRGLNTWDNPPKWLLDLSDMVDAKLPPLPEE